MKRRTFAEDVETLLATLDLRVWEVARLLRVSPATVYRWRGGKSAEGLSASLVPAVAARIRVTQKAKLWLWAERVRTILGRTDDAIPPLQALLSIDPTAYPCALCSKR